MSTAGPTRGGPWRWLLPAALLPPLAARALLLREAEGALGTADLRGLGSDLGAGLALLALARAVGSRTARALLLGLWGALHLAHLEHTRELGAGLQLSYAAYLLEPTFLFGSALAALSPLPLLLWVAAPAALGACAARGGGGLRAALLPAAAALLLLLPLAMAGGDPQRPGWRQTHFLPANLLPSRLASSAPTHPAPGDAPAEAPGAPLPRALRADLGGEPRLPLPRPDSNVLLVVLEGVPGGYLEPVARAHGLEPRFVLPRLSALARRGVLATSFVTHQRQTNRGLYALLCGDHPKLATALAKMTEYLDGGTRRCLPAVLRERGYATTYLQGAPLEFMFKDAFMARIGFERVLGDRDFESPRVRTSWGVDDGTLFRRALELVDELEARPRPWLLTLLTVGTHHPTILPPELRVAEKRERLRRAFTYLDESAGAFVAALEARGVLDDTLVVITVDESRGLAFPGGELARALSENWGVLLMLPPGGARFEIAEPLGQSDLALSIVDYLGLDARATPFIGRSAFRRYTTARRVYFSNTFKRWMFQVGAFEGREAILLCGEPEAGCTRYAVTGPGVFAAHPAPVGPDPEAAREIARVVRASLVGAGSGAAERGGPRSFELAPAEPVRLTGVRRQRILDGQNLHAPDGARLDFELSLELLGEAGTLTLRHSLEGAAQVAGGMPRRFDLDFELPELAAGDRLRLRYAARALSPVERLKVRLHVERAEGDALAVRLETARLTLSPGGGGPPARDAAAPTGRGLELLAPPQVEVEAATRD